MIVLSLHSSILYCNRYINKRNTCSPLFFSDSVSGSNIKTDWKNYANPLPIDTPSPSKPWSLFSSSKNPWNNFIVLSSSSSPYYSYTFELIVSEWCIYLSKIWIASKLYLYILESPFYSSSSSGSLSFFSFIFFERGGLPRGLGSWVGL